MGRHIAATAAVLFCAALAGCSDAAPPSPGNDRSEAVAGRAAGERALSNAAGSTAPADADADADVTETAANALRPTGAPGPAPHSSNRYAVSQVLGKRDRTLAGGDAVCDIGFVYAGREAEGIFWEGPCEAVTATMMNRTDLERLNRWERLDRFQQRFVQQMPGGKVLYVGGAFSAAVYPYGTTGTVEEVTVAD